MKLPPLRKASRAVLATAVLGCVSAFAQQATPDLMELPEYVRGLAAAIESRGGMPAGANSGTATAAAMASAAVGGGADAGATEEIVVQGRSRAVLRDRLVMAQDKLYSVYNDINPIDEFDIHCRMHAQTGTRMPQRVCNPNFEKRLSADKAQAVLAAFRGEAFGTNWQLAESEMMLKFGQLEDNMRELAEEHPELREAMLELYDVMQSLDPKRYGPER